MSLDTWDQLRAIGRNRNLGLLLAAAAVSQTGDWILATGVAFQVYALTGSTVASATVLLALQLPQVLIGTVAGAVADRLDQRRLMIGVNLALALVLLPLSVVSRADQLWIVYAVSAATACLSPFFVSAEASLLPALVDRPDRLVTANAANAQVRNLARLLGAALGGVLVSAGGFWAIAVADVASFVLATALLAAIRHRGRPSAAAPPRLVRDWVDGLRAIRRSRELRVVLIFFAVVGVGEALMGTLFAPFVHDVLRGDGTTFGVILGVQAVGGIVGGFLVTAFGHRFPARALFGWGAAVFGLLDLALFLYPLLVPGALPAIVIIALVGLPGAAMSAGLLTVFQFATHDRIRGRVFGALLTVQNATMLLGTLAAGVLAARIGVVPIITVQGLAYLVGGIAVLIALRRRTPVTPARPVRAHAAG